MNQTPSRRSFSAAGPRPWLVAALLLAMLSTAPARADVGGRGVTAVLPGVHAAWSLKERRFGIGVRVQSLLYSAGRSPATLEGRYTWFGQGLHDAALDLSLFRGDGRDHVVIYGGPSVGASLRIRDDEPLDLGVELGGSGAVLFNLPLTPGPYAFVMGRFSRRHKLDLTAGLGLQSYLNVSWIF